jgi:protein-L-isoaspartate(D-aspartate) O-methyltransferase
VSEALAARRRRFAEEIGEAASLPAPLVDAFATVPREHFLGPGPWLVWGERDTAARPTPDADPAHAYVNQSIAIDPARHLFNGLPSFLGMSIAALDLRPGHHVLHVGTGLGYYTAVMGALVGPGGSVLGVEVDDGLAARARSLVLPGSPVEIRHGDARGPFDRTFDAILVSAGVTHPLTAWLDALAPHGRIVLPLTAPMPMMNATIGKGLLVRLAGTGDGEMAARVLSFVAIYSAVGLRDDALQSQLTASMLRPASSSFTRLTRLTHDKGEACFLHTAEWCLRRG